MAFVGAAPVNGWGAVGFWPGLRIISIRAMPADQTTFPFDNYSRAIDLCNKQAIAHSVVTINLSLNCDCQPAAEEQARLEAEIGKAHNNGQSVVAAAGNSSRTIGSPAATPGAIAVAAAGRTSLCWFSNRGVGIDMLAPGCDIDLADPTTGELWRGYQSGTSGASMTTSAVLALLRSYRRDLSWQDAEQLVTDSARPTGDGPALDVESLLRAAGMSALVDAARARMPAPEAPPAPLGPTAGGGQGPEASYSPAGIWPRPLTAWAGLVPKLKVVRHGRHLAVTARNRPPRTRLRIALQTRHNEFGYVTVARMARSGATIRLRLPRRWLGGRLVARYELPDVPPYGQAAAYLEVRR
jgi:hypothetical protein